MEMIFGMNIYEMYYHNGKKYGFFVKRETWENIIAKIIAIDDIHEGDKITGKPPYFKNQQVVAEFYKCKEIEECNRNTYINSNVLSCAGNFSYILILPK